MIGATGGEWHAPPKRADIDRRARTLGPAFSLQIGVFDQPGEPAASGGDSRLNCSIWATKPAVSRPSSSCYGAPDRWKVRLQTRSARGPARHRPFRGPATDDLPMCRDRPRSRRRRRGPRCRVGEGGRPSTRPVALHREAPFGECPVQGWGRRPQRSSFGSSPRVCPNPRAWPQRTTGDRSRRGGSANSCPYDFARRSLRAAAASLRACSRMFTHESPSVPCQQSNANQHNSLRSRSSSSTSSRISWGSWARCHWHSKRPAVSRSSSGPAARAALIA